MEESPYQGLQNQMFGVFIILLVLVQLIFQTFPRLRHSADIV